MTVELSESLSVLSLSPCPADGPQSSFLIHSSRVPQISSQQTSRLRSGHLRPQWSGEDKYIQAYCAYIVSYNVTMIKNKNVFLVFDYRNYFLLKIWKN